MDRSNVPRRCRLYGNYVDETVKRSSTCVGCGDDDDDDDVVPTNNDYVRVARSAFVRGLSNIGKAWWSGPYRRSRKRRWTVSAVRTAVGCDATNNL